MTRSDRNCPNVVLAPEPGRRELIIRLYANPVTLRGFLVDSMNAKLGEYCGLVHGNIVEATPDGPVEGGTNGLMDAVALFRGIKRPMVDADLDKDVYIYVTNPHCSYVYPASERFANAGPTRVPKPNDSVFVTYVEIGQRADATLRDWLGDKARHLKLGGIVQDWEWVPHARDDPRLPERHRDRYMQTEWS